MKCSKIASLTFYQGCMLLSDKNGTERRLSIESFQLEAKAASRVENGTTMIDSMPL